MVKYIAFSKDFFFKQAVGCSVRKGIGNSSILVYNLFVFLERKFLDGLKSRREVHPTESHLLWWMSFASLGEKRQKK